MFEWSTSIMWRGQYSHQISLGDIAVLRGTMKEALLLSNVLDTGNCRYFTLLSEIFKFVASLYICGDV